MNRLAVSVAPPAQVVRRLRGVLVTLPSSGREWLELRAGEDGQRDLAIAVARLIDPPGRAAHRTWTALANRRASEFAADLAGAEGLLAIDTPAGVVVGGADAGIAAELVEGAATGLGGLVILGHDPEAEAEIRELLLRGDVAAAAARAAVVVVMATEPGTALVSGDSAGLAPAAGALETVPGRRRRRRRAPAALVLLVVIAVIALVARVTGGSSPGIALPSPSAAAPRTAPIPTGPTLPPASPRSGDAPSARQSPTTAWDPIAGRLLLFGGTGDAAPRLDLADTWTWDGLTWRTQHPGSAPPARFAAVMAPAPDGGLLLVGGMHRVGIDFVAQPLQDTWRWDGSNWTAMAAAGGPAPGDHTVALVADPSAPGGRGLLLLSSSANGVTSAFRWSGASWTPVHASGTAPHVRLAAADPEHQQVIVVAGDGSPIQVSSTWAWRNGTWTSLRPPLGVYVDDTALFTFDPVSRRPLLVEDHFIGEGGVVPPDEDRGGTWIWDGQTWAQLPGPVPGFVSTFNATSEAVAYPGGVLTLVGGDREKGAYRQAARWNAAASQWEQA